MFVFSIEEILDMAIKIEKNGEAVYRTAIEKLESFFRDLNITTALRDIVVDADALPSICQMATQDACLITNPREATVETMLKICKASW